MKRDTKVMKSDIEFLKKMIVITSKIKPEMKPVQPQRAVTLPLGSSMTTTPTKVITPESVRPMKMPLFLTPKQSMITSPPLMQPVTKPSELLRLSMKNLIQKLKD